MNPEGTRQIVIKGKSSRVPGAATGVLLRPNVAVCLMTACFVLWIGIRMAGLDYADAPHLFIKVGYAAFFMMLVSILSVYRHQLTGKAFAKYDMHFAMKVHVLASFLAFAGTLIHCRGEFDSFLGILIMAVFFIVMLSGVLGIAVQRHLYRAMALVLPKEESGSPGEVGFDLIESEKEKIQKEAERLIRNYSLLIESDILDWTGFCSKLQEEATGNPKGISGQIWSGLTGGARDVIKRGVVFGEFRSEDRAIVAAEIDTVMQTINIRPAIITEELKSGVAARMEEQPRRGRDSSITDLFKKISDGEQTDIRDEKERVRRLILENLFPAYIARSERPTDTIEKFFKDEVADYLNGPLPPLRFILDWRSSEPISWNHFQQVRSSTPVEQHGLLDKIWELVMKRRRLDLEYILHRLAHIWRPVHFIGAWLLFIIVLAHVIAGIWFDGLWVPFLLPLT